MTVEQMIAERDTRSAALSAALTTALAAANAVKGGTASASVSALADDLDTELAAANAAVSTKGGTVVAHDINGLPNAIAAIPTGGSLDPLTHPASAAQIVAAKEAYDDTGTKITGTLNVCSTVAIDTDDQAPYVSGGMAYAPIKSTADNSSGVVSWSEPDALAANIVAEKTILGVKGEAQGSSVTVEPLSVTANGTYTAPTGKAYSPVTVNVQGGGGETEITVTSDCVNAAEVASALAPLIPGVNSDYYSSAIFKSVDSFSEASVNQVLFVSINAKGTNYSGVWGRKSSGTTVYEATSFASVYTNTIISSGAKFKMVTLEQPRP